MTNSGLSRWVIPPKMKNEKGDISQALPEPLMCECGGSIPIGKNGDKVASFFYEDFEYICLICGLVLEPNKN